MGPFITIQKPPMSIVGVMWSTSKDSRATLIDTSGNWQQFYQEELLQKIADRTSDDVLALYCDAESDLTKSYSLVLGCPARSSRISDQMVTKTIPGGTYALFRAVGNYPTSLVKTWQLIENTQLKRTYNGDHELYRRSFFSQLPHQVSIAIAIEPKPSSLYLYKILSEEDWKDSQGQDRLILPQADEAFIHFSTQDQFDRILNKYWSHTSHFVIVQIEADKLPGRLVLEKNPGGTEPYYHLYEGWIPLNTIAHCQEPIRT